MEYQTQDIISAYRTFLKQHDEIVNALDDEAYQQLEPLGFVNVNAHQKTIEVAHELDLNVYSAYGIIDSFNDVLLPMVFATANSIIVVYASKYNTRTHKTFADSTSALKFLTNEILPNPDVICSGLSINTTNDIARVVTTLSACRFDIVTNSHILKIGLNKIVWSILGKKYGIIKHAWFNGKRQVFYTYGGFWIYIDDVSKKSGIIVTQDADTLLNLL